MRLLRTGVIVSCLILCGASPLLAQPDEQLEAVELQAMADTFQYALEYNPTDSLSDWVNPDTTRSGAVVPTRTFENTQGQPCREFITTIIIAGQEEQGYGTACRQPDGNWKLEPEASVAVTAPTQKQVTTYTYIDHYPAAYYAYPRGFFGPYSIYLSFGQVYRGGRLHVGSRYMDGRTFRTRNSFVIRHRVNSGPRIHSRYRLYDELNYRDWDRHNRKQYEKDYRKDKKRDKRWGDDLQDDRSNGGSKRKGRN